MDNYHGSEHHKNIVAKASILGNIKKKELAEKRKCEYYLDPKRCLECESPIKYEAKSYGIFCSRNCSAKYSNKNRKHSFETKEKIKNSLIGKISPFRGTGKRHYIELQNKICLNCNNNFETNKSDKKFCSSYCGRKYKSPETRLKLSEAIKKRIKEGTHRGWQVRKNRSYAEKFFEQVLIDNNIKFDAEYKIKKTKLGFNDSYNYFLDFYFQELKLDLEIDGKQHEYTERKLSDSVRDMALTKYGITVYRIKWKNPNNDRNKEYIKNEIKKFLEFYKNFPLAEAGLAPDLHSG